MSEKEDHLAKVAAVATEADMDTELALDGLFSMVIQRREDPDLKVQYELTRDELVARLKEDGPRYFLASDGTKRYAYVVQPEQIEVDMDELMAAVKDGSISQEVLDKIAPRKVDKDALRRAVAKKQIDAATFVRIAELVKKTAHVGFSDPVD